MAQVLGIDFVLYYVSDLDRAVSFYERRLGLKLAGRWDSYRWAEFDTEPVTLALSEVRDTARIGAEPTAASLLPKSSTAQDGKEVPVPAIGLAVADVDSALEELRRAGVKVLVETVESGVCHMALITDPDGNALWLHRRKDGTVG